MLNLKVVETAARRKRKCKFQVKITNCCPCCLRMIVGCFRSLQSVTVTICVRQA